ncbi:MAG: hypothetical protein JWM80_118 [Cyanobacteria bacterium RYN_339]|nr:hypothetical protein [Cyanobacteria bacterium RYN_339]
MDNYTPSNNFEMTEKEAIGLYGRLRGDMLRATQHHRRSSSHPGFSTDIHRSHLRTCQRQLGALRQAYRRTQEAIAWQQYANTWYDAQ